MDYFNGHLRGKPYHILIDESPLPQLGHLHKKMLARFCAAMDEGIGERAREENSSITQPRQIAQFLINQFVVETFTPIMNDEIESSSGNKEERLHMRWVIRCFRHRIFFRNILRPDFFNGCNLLF